MFWFLGHFLKCNWVVSEEFQFVCLKGKKWEILKHKGLFHLLAILEATIVNLENETMS